MLGVFKPKIAATLWPMNHRPHVRVFVRKRQITIQKNYFCYEGLKERLSGEEEGRSILSPM